MLRFRCFKKLGNVSSSKVTGLRFIARCLEVGFRYNGVHGIGGDLLVPRSVMTGSLVETRPFVNSKCILFKILASNMQCDKISISFEQLAMSTVQRRIGCSDGYLMFLRTTEWNLDRLDQLLILFVIISA